MPRSSSRTQSQRLVNRAAGRLIGKYGAENFCRQLDSRRVKLCDLRGLHGRCGGVARKVGTTVILLT